MEIKLRNFHINRSWLADWLAGQTGKRQRAKAIEVSHQRMLP